MFASGCLRHQPANILKPSTDNCYFLVTLWRQGRGCCK